MHNDCTCASPVAASWKLRKSRPLRMSVKFNSGSCGEAGNWNAGRSTCCGSCTQKGSNVGQITCSCSAQFWACTVWYSFLTCMGTSRLTSESGEWQAYYVYTVLFLLFPPKMRLSRSAFTLPERIPPKTMNGQYRSARKSVVAPMEGRITTVLIVKQCLFNELTAGGHQQDAHRWHVYRGKLWQLRDCHGRQRDSRQCVCCHLQQPFGCSSAIMRLLRCPETLVLQLVCQFPQLSAAMHRAHMENLTCDPLNVR